MRLRRRSTETLLSLLGAQCQLPELGEPGHADADEAQRPRPIAETAVEEPAGNVADPSRVVDADLERGRAAADGEVGVAELRRHRPRGLAPRAQVAGDFARHPAQLVVQPLPVEEVALERVLDRDGDPLDFEVEPARINPAGSVAEDGTDASRQQAAQLLVAERCELPDRLDPARAQ